MVCNQIQHCDKLMNINTTIIVFIIYVVQSVSKTHVSGRSNIQNNKIFRFSRSSSHSTTTKHRSNQRAIPTILHYPRSIQSCSNDHSSTCNKSLQPHRHHHHRHQCSTSPSLVQVSWAAHWPNRWSAHRSPNISRLH